MMIGAPFFLSDKFANLRTALVILSRNWQSFVCKIPYFTECTSYTRMFLCTFIYCRSSWQPRGDYISSTADLCSQQLVYTARLVKPGKVTYTYQFTDVNVIFNFVVSLSLLQLGQCTTHVIYLIMPLYMYAIYKIKTWIGV